MEAPRAIPAIDDSARGVSITRDSPNSSRKPSVARKTPPLAPMSSPSMNTLSSRRISSLIASLTASSTVFIDISSLRTVLGILK